MAVIYLKHPIHGTKVACGRLEADTDISNGWEEFVREDRPAVVEPVSPEEFVKTVLGGGRKKKSAE